MGKLTKKIYKGIDYIELKDLTPAQSIALKAVLKRNQIIHIQVDGEIKRDCVQYHHYEEWYKSTETVFSGSRAQVPAVTRSTQDIPKVALGT